MTLELQMLKQAGAQCVAGDLIFNREVVGMLRHGQFILTEAGAQVLAAERAEAQAAAAPAARTKTGKRSALPTPPAPEATPAPEAPADDLDDLLK